ncbi:MAG: purine-nucleoside phosphorylase [Rhodoferax sp.]|nr:purine-nucleoside phosphorylase [Rhodoferax sp.]
MPTDPAAIAATVAQLASTFGPAPDVAVVLGSGWAPAARQMDDALHIPYSALPAFAATQVDGHVNELVLGRCGAQRVAMLLGRSHTYESGDCAAMAGAVRSLKAWGVETLVLTNAAGSLRAHIPPGSLMLIADHINAVQHSPLLGETGHAAFVDMTAAYAPELRTHARSIAARCQQPLAEGTYVWVQGPQFETPAEIRMFAAWGADAVGMSTVPETILARHAGLRVLGLSLITNMAAGLSSEALTHAATLRQAEMSSAAASRFLFEMLSSW